MDTELGTIIEPKSEMPLPEPEDDAFHSREIVTLGLAHGTNDMFFAFIPPLQPLIMEKLALNNTQAGLFAVFLQGPSIFQPFIGHFADKHNLRYVFILAPTLSALVLTMVGLAPNYGILALLMVLAGFSTAGFHSIAPVISAVRSGKKMGRGMGIFMLFGEMGSGIGPLLVVIIVGALTINGLPWLISLGVLCSTILYLNFRNISTVRPLQNERQPQIWGMVRGMSKIFVPIFGMLFITSLIYANIINFLPTFLKGEGASFFFAGSAFSIVEFSATVGIFFSGWISDRIGQRLIIILSTITTVLFSLLLLNVQGWLQIPILIGLGLLAFSANPSFLAIVQHHFYENRSLANGIYMSGNFVIRSLGVFLVGVLADHFGLRAVFTSSCWIALLALPLAFLLPKK